VSTVADWLFALTRKPLQFSRETPSISKWTAPRVHFLTLSLAQFPHARERCLTVPLKPVQSTWTELNCVANGRTEIHVFRTDRAPTVLVSLQPIVARHRRAWPMNVSCIWVDLSQTSLQFACCEQTFSRASSRGIQWSMWLIMKPVRDAFTTAAGR